MNMGTLSDKLQALNIHVSWTIALSLKRCTCYRLSCFLIRSWDDSSVQKALRWEEQELPQAQMKKKLCESCTSCTECGRHTEIGSDSVYCQYVVCIPLCSPLGERWYLSQLCCSSPSSSLQLKQACVQLHHRAVLCTEGKGRTRGWPVQRRRRQAGVKSEDGCSGSGYAGSAALGLLTFPAVLYGPT